MDKYIINCDTIAVIGIDSKSCKIIEKDRELIVNKNSFSVIEDSCLYYGASYQGRVDASNILISNSYKVPIVVENTNNLVFFPTISPNSNLCMWISIDMIFNNVIDKKTNSCKIIFKNNTEILTNLSSYSLENQMLKSYILHSIMKSRNYLKKF